MPETQLDTGERTKKRSRARVIAFYLPQFHPIPENDKWWGKGFTEWTVVSSAKPLFRGHYQPRIPADLGYYDLRLPEARSAQAELAMAHGIEGFCYWHYWLGNGKRLLERPFEAVLREGEPEMPFCVGWANHSWKGVFFGAGGNTLIEQEYGGIEDYKAHFYTLLRAFTDNRYITVDGKPVFFIFAPFDIPDVKKFVDLWQALAIQEGLKGLHMVGGDISLQQAGEIGIDAVSFYRHRIIEHLWPANHRLRKMLHWFRTLFKRPGVFNYKRAMQYFNPPGLSPIGEYPVIIPNWDTSPRLGEKAVVLHGSTPELFRNHVRETFKKVAHKPYERRIVFAKSWNEWAEGNYLEPDQKYGKGYLEAIKAEVSVSSP